MFVVELMITEPSGVVRYETRLAELVPSPDGHALSFLRALQLQMLVGQEVEVDWRIPGTKLHGAMAFSAPPARPAGG